MVVGGPNRRTDFHVNPTPEFFYQHKGSLLLRTVPGDGVGQPGPPNSSSKNTPASASGLVDVVVPPGGFFLLPANTPHSPVRFADTVGVVLEMPRPGQPGSATDAGASRNANENANANLSPRSIASSAIPTAPSTLTPPAPTETPAILASTSGEPPSHSAAEAAAAASAPVPAMDRMRWYCLPEWSGCGALVWEKAFVCVDLGTQVRGVIQEFQGLPDEERRCRRCGKAVLLGYEEGMVEGKVNV